MDKFFIQDGMISRFDFMDNQEFLPLPTVCNLLNQNNLDYEKLKQKYLDLKERAVFPKFKPKSDLFVIVGYADETKAIEQFYIDEIVIRGDGSFIEYRDIDQETIIGEDNLVFATYEEAEKELNEIINVYKQAKKKENIDRLVEDVESQAGQDLKPMWDKWKEETTKQIKETLKGEEDG